MDYRSLVRPSVLTQPVYEPGKPIEYVAREYGLDPRKILKLASNENPLGPSPKGLEAARRALEESHLYPDGGCVALREKLAERLGLSAGQFVVGNGSNDVMVLLAQAFVGPGDEVVFGSQAFIVYKLATLLFGGTPVEVPMPGLKHDLAAMAAAVTGKTRLVFLPSPNNPTGTVNSQEEIYELVRALPPHVIFCFDEAYAEYVENPPDLRPLIEEGYKVFCTRTFSKIYGLAGFRLGYGYGPPELCALLNQIRQPFNVNAIGQKAALAALDDESFVKESRRVNRDGLRQLEAGLAALGVETVPSAGNFILVGIGDSQRLFQLLQASGIIVRPLHGYGLPGFVRVSVGTESQNHRFLQVMEALLSGEEGESLRGDHASR